MLISGGFFFSPLPARWGNFTSIWECDLLLNKVDAFKWKVVEENKITAVTDLGIYTRRKSKTDRLEIDMYC